MTNDDDYNPTAAERWEQEIENDPRSRAIVELVSRVDGRWGDFHCDISLGGDGDNGEELVFAFDRFFLDLDRQDTPVYSIPVDTPPKTGPLTFVLPSGAEVRGYFISPENDE